MTFISVEKDAESLTMTIIAQFDAPTTRVWQVWQDPRQLERWWGPPTYPATVVGHDLTPGGRVTYFMTGPEGDAHHGWWSVSAVEAPPLLGVHRRLCRRGRQSQSGDARHEHTGQLARGVRRDADGGHDGLPDRPGHGTAHRDGNGGRHGRRDGTDRRPSDDREHLAQRRSQMGRAMVGQAAGWSGGSGLTSCRVSGCASVRTERTKRREP